MCCIKNVEGRGLICGFGSFFTYFYEFWGWNSSYQACVASAFFFPTTSIQLPMHLLLVLWHFLFSNHWLVQLHKAQIWKTSNNITAYVNFPFFLCVQVLVWVHAHVHSPVCGGKRSNLADIQQLWFTLFC